MIGSAPEDPHRLLAGLTRDRVSLELSTLDICFLAALHLQAERDGLASLDEELLLNLFEQVSDLVDPSLENRQVRATHAIQRLRSQRMLARVDATGIISAGEYSLTRLGMLIVQSFLEQEQLTRESLSLLMGAVTSSLAQIRARAERISDPSEWQTAIVGPLRVTVGDLVAGIERRQRGLDMQQEEVRKQISTLLQVEWFNVIEGCQTLLETMAKTLRELNEVLLRDSSHIQTLLQEIQHAAVTAGATEAEQAAQRVTDHVARMEAWGRSRQQGWSNYYQYVHRFLRDVVRLDPDRAISQRLVEQIRSWPERPFAFVVAADSCIRLLRPMKAMEYRPPVSRPRGEWEQDPAIVAADESPLQLESLVLAALKHRPRTLATLTTEIIAQLSDSERYTAIGRIAAVVARVRAPLLDRERPWVPVSPSFIIEDWMLERPDPQ